MSTSSDYYPILHAWGYKAKTWGIERVEGHHTEELYAIRFMGSVLSFPHQADAAGQYLAINEQKDRRNASCYYIRTSNSPSLRAYFKIERCEKGIKFVFIYN